MWPAKGVVILSGKENFLEKALLLTLSFLRGMVGLDSNVALFIGTGLFRLFIDLSPVILLLTTTLPVEAAIVCALICFSLTDCSG